MSKSKKKTKKQKMVEYDAKYSSVPNDIRERISYLLKELEFSTQDIEDYIELKTQIIENNNLDVINIVIYESPEGSNRPRYNRFKERMYVPNAMANRKIIGDLIKCEFNDFKLICTPVYIDIKFFSSIPSGMKKSEMLLSEEGFILPISKPDFDNGAKNYTDPLTGVLYIDDAYIVDARVRKFYSLKPRIEIELKWLRYINSSYQYKNIKNSKVYQGYLNDDRVRDLEFIGGK